MNDRSVLPRRSGPRPRTTPWAPHVQQGQNAPPAMVAALAARVEPLRHAGTHRVVEAATEVGEPAAAIVRVARETGAHAIVMAAHLHDDLGHLVRGSVSTRTLRRADVPVLLVPPAAPRRKSRSDPSTTAARRA